MCRIWRENSHAQCNSLPRSPLGIEILCADTNEKKIISVARVEIQRAEEEITGACRLQLTATRKTERFALDLSARSNNPSAGTGTKANKTATRSETSQTMPLTHPHQTLSRS